MTNDRKIELLADWLEKQVVDSSITDGRIWQEMAVSERTFYRLKPKAAELMNMRLTERQKQAEATKVLETIEAAKNGLKTKTERVMILQNQVDEILIDLTDDEISLTAKAYLRKTLKDIQAEISKIEGDYAPTKQALTDKDGNDIPQPKLTPEQLEKLIDKI
jgi:hypothetical protein